MSDLSNTIRAFCFGPDGNRRGQVVLHVDDRVDWKRNGTRGSFKARVSSIGKARVRLCLISHDGRPMEVLKHVNVKPDFLAVYRNDERLFPAP